MINEIFKNNSEFVTKAELRQLINKLTSMKMIQGRPGRDAVITKELVDAIRKSVVPIKGVHYKDGKDGKDGAPGAPGRDADNITPDQLKSKLLEIKDGIPMDLINGSETLVKRLQEIIENNNILTQKLGHVDEEFVVFRDKVKAIEILHSKRKGDTFLESQVLNGTDLVSTLNNGTDITTDLSSLVDVTLYTGDGTINGDREVTVVNGEFYINGATVWGVENDNGDQLQIDGGLSFSGSNGSSINLNGSISQIGVAPTGQLQLQTPNVNNATATNGQVLTLINAATGETDWADATGGGGLWQDVIDAQVANDGPGYLYVQGESGNWEMEDDGAQFLIRAGGPAYGLNLQGNQDLVLQAQAIKIETPAILGATATNGQVLTLIDDATGEAEWQDAATDTFIASGVLTSGNNNLEITLNDSSIVNIDVTALNSGTTYTADEGVSLNGTTFELGYNSIAGADADKLTSHRFIHMNQQTGFPPTGQGYGFVMQGFTPAHTPGQQSIVLGGFGNTAQGNFTGAVIGSTNSDADAGGIYSSGNATIVGSGAILASGNGSIDTSANSVIAGGLDNVINSTFTGGRNFIGGGEGNQIINTNSGSMNAIIAGRDNTINTSLAFNTIVGGSLNTITGAQYAFIGGGQLCSASTNAACFGIHNHAQQSSTVVGTYSLNAPASNVWGGHRFRVGVGSDDLNRADGFVVSDTGNIFMPELPTYANNAAAISGGLGTHGVYKTATGELRIVV